MLVQIFPNLTPSTLLLTANTRLAAWLMEEYAIYQQGQGLSGWPNLNLYTLDDYLDVCWQQAIFQQAIPSLIPLTEIQELAVWESVIRTSNASHALLRSYSTARLAREAWQTLTYWQITPTAESFKQTADTAAFYEWCHYFKEYCHDARRIDRASMLATLLPAIPHLKLPQQIMTLGFDEMPPLGQRFLQSFTQSGCQLINPSLAVNNATVQQLGLPDTLSEINTMAAWARQVCQQDHSHRIVCCVPNLQQHRLDLLQSFSEHFKQPSAFNIAGGQALREYPLINAALLALSLHRSHITQQDCSALLRSPFIGDAESEVIERTKVDYQLAKLGAMSVSLRENLHHLHQCPKWQQRLMQFYQLPIADTEQLPSQWVDIFKQQLLILGWPGERRLNSTEFQLQERWQRLLQSYASLDDFLAKQTFEQALAYLHHLTGQISFQAQTERTRVQILGLLEANTMPMTHCWVMGLHDEVWPAPPEPNPFIPLALQRHHQTPHANFERELTYAHLLTQRLKNSASQVVFSYPLRDNDRPLRASPLLTDIPECKVNDLEVDQELTRLSAVMASSQMETINDTQGPPVTQDESLRGGTSIFKAFAACPLRAFVHYRLHAKATEKPTLGLSAKDRGNLLHRALELIWQKLKNQQALCNLTEAEQNFLIQQTLTQTICEFTSQRSSQKHSRFIELEQQHLHHLINKWLQYEKQRPAFTVFATEQTLAFQMANLNLQIRIDRIDELTDGARLLIDYKTSPTSIKHWFGTRLEEPQLPLYSLHYHDIHGLTYAQIRSQEVKFNGIAIQSDLASGIKEITQVADPLRAIDWQAQLQDWKMHLQQIAEQFSQGAAALDPKDPPQTCQHCDLTVFCRIHEQVNAS